MGNSEPMTWLNRSVPWLDWTLSLVWAGFRCLDMDWTVLHRPHFMGLVCIGLSTRGLFACWWREEFSQSDHSFERWGDDKIREAGSLPKSFRKCFSTSWSSVAQVQRKRWGLAGPGLIVVTAGSLRIIQFHPQ